MKVPLSKKILIASGLALVLLAAPIGLLSTNINSVIPKECATSYWPSYCADGAQTYFGMWVFIGTLILGSLVVLIAFLKK